jgi:hypothetical protein
MSNTIKAPLTVHEDLLDRHYLRDEKGEKIADEAIGALQAALRTARTGAEQLASLAAAQAADKTMVPAAAKAKLREIGLQVGERAAHAIEQARTAVADEIASGEREMRPSDPADPHLIANMRGRLAAMTVEERREIIGKAFAQGDDETAYAILQAPAWVTGLLPSELESRRYEWQRKKFPAERERFDRLGKAIQITDLMSRSFSAFIVSLVDDSDAIAAAQAQKAVADALSQILQEGVAA